ncbi:MAG TPA: hypothetical protein VLV83_09040 [Acidobacteriota bacterium]|nr:hypothetical protein [Acidobacteriota bacterium]
MKKLTIKIISLLSIILLLGGVAVMAQNPNSSNEASKMVAKGKLVSVDTDAQTFQIETEEGETVTFMYNEETKVTGAQSVQGLADNQGTWVTIQYRTENSEHTALAIHLNKGKPGH